MKPMPRSAMQVSPQRAAIRAEQGSQGLKKFDQANYQNRQAAMPQMQQDMYPPNQDFMKFAVQPYSGMQAPEYIQGSNFVKGLGSGIAAGLGSGIVANRNEQTDSRQYNPWEQAYAGGNPNFDERTGQSNNLIRYNNPSFPQGPDRMGMPQAYPDRIADPMRPQGDRGPLTRLSPGVYRNTQGQLTGPGGRVMPNQPNRDAMQGNMTNMFNNMQPQNPQGNISDLYNNMQPGYPNGKGPARDVYSPMGAGGYDINQAQNPIYGSFGNGYNLPQNTNVMPGYAGPRPSYSPGQWLNRGR